MIRPSYSLRARTGFSLVEVVIALGVVAFCIVAILTLFTVGLRSSRDSVEELRAASLASSLVARMRAAPQEDLTAAGFPFGPLTNDGGSLFEISSAAPTFLNGDGTVATGMMDAVSSGGCAMSGEGSYDIDTRVAVVSFTLWWPASAAYADAMGSYSVSTFIDTVQ